MPINRMPENSVIGVVNIFRANAVSRRQNISAAFQQNTSIREVESAIIQ